MEIIINDRTRVRVTSEYYAPLKKNSNKKQETGYDWIEYMWFTNLPSLIKYLTQKTLSEKDVTVSLKEFLELYKEVNREIKGVLEASGIR